MYGVIFNIFHFQGVLYFNVNRDKFMQAKLGKYGNVWIT